jgi:hypothetical protein
MNVGRFRLTLYRLLGAIAGCFQMLVQSSVSIAHFVHIAGRSRPVARDHQTVPKQKLELSGLVPRQLCCGERRDRIQLPVAAEQVAIHPNTLRQACRL